MKQKSRTFTIALVLVLMFQPLAACRSGLNGAVPAGREERAEFVVGAADIGDVYSFSENGFFYLQGGCMRYYDLATDSSSVFCGLPNCMHIQQSCPARYGGVPESKNAIGLAAYGDYAYVMKLNEEAATFDLLQMDLSGNLLQTIYSMKLGNDSFDSWRLSSIDSVVYADNRAWVTAAYTCQVEVKARYLSYDRISVYCRQVLGINLDDGSCETLSWLPEFDQLGRNYDYRIKAISNDYLVLERSQYSLAKLSYTQFLAAYEDGKMQQFSDEYNAYFDYEKWHVENNHAMYKLELYNMKTGEYSLLAEGEYEPCFADIGYFIEYLPEYSFYGVYEGDFIYRIIDYATATSKLYRCDPASGQSELLFDMKQDTLIGVFDGQAMYYSPLSETEITVCSYSMTYGNHQKLFVDSSKLSFQIRAETEDCFLGERPDFGIGVDPPLFIINKADYYNGNLEAAKLLNMIAI